MTVKFVDIRNKVNGENIGVRRNVLWKKKISYHNLRLSNFNRLRTKQKVFIVQYVKKLIKQKTCLVTCMLSSKNGYNFHVEQILLLKIMVQFGVLIILFHAPVFFFFLKAAERVFQLDYCTSPASGR